MANVRVLSYNLKFHRAYSETIDIIRDKQPDIVCLQECYAHELDDDLAGLSLSAVTTVGHLGLATYTNTEKFKVDESHEVPLPLSVFERVLRKKRTRLLVSKLIDMSGNQFLVGNFHATEYVGTNSLRHRQTTIALQTLRQISDEAPSVLIGDYNYAVFHENLRNVIVSNGYNFLAAAGPTFSGFGLKHSLDFASSRNLQATNISVLPFAGSDHAPLLIDFETSEV